MLCVSLIVRVFRAEAHIWVFLHPLLLVLREATSLSYILSLIHFCLNWSVCMWDGIRFDTFDFETIKLCLHDIIQIFFFGILSKLNRSLNIWTRVRRIRKPVSSVRRKLWHFIRLHCSPDLWSAKLASFGLYFLIFVGAMCWVVSLLLPRWSL